MGETDRLARHYLREALHSTEMAHAYNRDAAMGQLIQRALGILQEADEQAGANSVSWEFGAFDPYEIDEFNSAI